jgi:membrane fusion protein, heavy metal efflux system
VSEAPIIGQRVSKGQVLARMTPALGESGAVFADARARLREAEDEHERAKRLFAAEAIPERRLHEAEIRLTAAREALAGLGGGSLTTDGRVAIVAPIDGVISERSVTPGARVEAGTPLFTIVESSVVWVTAHVPAAQAARLDRRANATVLVEGATEVLRTSRVVAVGTVIDPDTRTVPVTYELADRAGVARVGAVARVAVPTAARREGVVVPAGAILEEDGRPFVFVQLDGELFERRDVTVESTDGLRTLVRTGLAVRERVVTGAAYQLKLASMSTAVPAHGHEH